MIIYYFGADEPWHQQNERNISRRNMAMLIALANNKDVTTVYNIIRCTRQLVIKKWLKKEPVISKIKNIYIAPLLPERWLLTHVSRPLNRLLLKLLNFDAFIKQRKENLISWTYWPKGYEDYNYLKIDSTLVFDTDHNIIGEPNIENAKLEQRKKLLLEIGGCAYSIVSSSRSMLFWFNQHGYLNTHLLMNGVFLSRININQKEANQGPYKITYCGTLSRWIQIDWLIRAIRENPHWHFNIIGKNYKTNLYEKLQEYSNVNLFGFLEPRDVDAILRRSDVCVGLYQKNKAIDVNSMKIYDYLSQGCPVVVNRYHDHLQKDFNSLLNVASSYEEFVAMLRNPKPINKIELEGFLKSSAWNRRVEPLLSQLHDYVPS